MNFKLQRLKVCFAQANDRFYGRYQHHEEALIFVLPPFARQGIAMRISPESVCRDPEAV
jgi:hypothetical protein